MEKELQITTPFLMPESTVTDLPHSSICNLPGQTPAPYPIDILDRAIRSDRSFDPLSSIVRSAPLDRSIRWLVPVWSKSLTGYCTEG